MIILISLACSEFFNLGFSQKYFSTLVKQTAVVPVQKKAIVSLWKVEELLLSVIECT
jgi:hypothetical protein